VNDDKTEMMMKKIVSAATALGVSLTMTTMPLVVMMSRKRTNIIKIKRIRRYLNSLVCKRTR